MDAGWDTEIKKCKPFLKSVGFQLLSAGLDSTFKNMVFDVGGGEIMVLPDVTESEILPSFI